MRTMRAMRIQISLFAVLLAGTACPKSADTRPDTAPQIAVPPAAPTKVDLAALDRNTDPCDDFYQFACGGWLDATEIPADQPAWSRGFSELRERNQALLRRILEEAAAGELDSPFAQKMGDFYAACMDEGQQASLETLHQELAAIDGLDDRERLATTVAELHRKGANAFFWFGSSQDYRDTTQVIGRADQGGLGLPDRDYYLREDEKSRELLANYRAHVARMFELAGASAEEAKANADVVLAIETELAAASLPRVERRDPYKVYHRLDRTGLAALAPAFDFDTYFATLGQPDLQPINVAVPGFFERLDQVLQRPASELQTYLRWHVIHANASTLPEAFVMADFDFRSKNLTGQETILPRWKRCVSATDGALGEALARPYIDLTFGSEGKEMALELIRDVEAAFASNLDGIDWMDDATRVEARQKLEALRNKIGYPEQWRDYTALEVDRSSWMRNRMHAAAFDTARDLEKIGQPVDPHEWFMSPPTVNAYYSPLRNEMVFPAGILQPPFFSAEATEAANFGGIGMVMGHEITHGFDDRGRQFDAEGNLREWWTPEVSEAYRQRAQCVVDQYAAYEVEGLNLDGRLTLGENIADIGGLKLAWIALQAEQERRGEGPEVEGFTEDQQLFLSYAQSWCTRRRPAYARMLVTVDPHSPPEYRVNGAIVNQPGFAEAFACEPGSPMVPLERCEVW